MSTKTFVFHFTGDTIAPSAVHLGDIVKLLDATGDVLFSLASEDDQKLQKETLGLFLNTVQSGSLTIELGASMPDSIESAFDKISDVVESGFEQSLPALGMDALSRIIQFEKKYKANLDLVVQNGSAEKITTIPFDISLPGPAFLQGETTLYGMIVRVGGVEPKVEIKTIDGKTLYCPFDKSLAGRLGERLYQVVGLSGKARFNIANGQVEYFEVEEITPYQPTSILEAFEGLSTQISEYYVGVNPEQYIAELRGEDWRAEDCSP